MVNLLWVWRVNDGLISIVVIKVLVVRASLLCSVQCTSTRAKIQSLIFSVRGVYLASLLFTDDEKLLVTVDENIPIIEVDDNHPSTFLQDFCWLMKVQTLRK